MYLGALAPKAILFNGISILRLAGVWCRTSHRNGRTAIYVNRTINNVVIVDLSEFAVDIDFELFVVLVVDQNWMIIYLYRSLLGNMENFLNRLESYLR